MKASGTTIEIGGIDHVQLVAPPGSEREARAFFGGVLGLEEIPKPATLAGRGGVWFACGPQELHVGVDPEFVPARKAHPSFVVRGFDALHSRLAAAGAGEDAAPEIPGVRRFYSHDPFGNRLEFRDADAGAAEATRDAFLTVTVPVREGAR